MLSHASTLSTSAIAGPRYKYFGDYLVEYGIISRKQLEQALQNQRDLQKMHRHEYRLGDILVFRGWVSRDHLEQFFNTLITLGL